MLTKSCALHEHESNVNKNEILIVFYEDKHVMLIKSCALHAGQLSMMKTKSRRISKRSAHCVCACNIEWCVNWGRVDLKMGWDVDGCTKTCNVYTYNSPYIKRWGCASWDWIPPSCGGTGKHRDW